MNAPSLAMKSPDLAGRDPFGAYVCDEATAKIMQAVIAERNWGEDRVVLGGIDGAVRALAVSSSPMFLIIDLSESESPRGDINALAEVVEPGTIVLALGTVNDVNFYRDLLASGIQDYLVKPVSEDAIRDAIAHAELLLSQPTVSTQEEVAQEHMCAVIGVRGGVGASTVATGCAWIAAHEMNKKVALLDLDVHFGTDSLAFDLEPGRGLVDALENPGRVDSLFLERATIKESDKLAILGAEAPINSPMIPDPSALGHLQGELKSSYEVVIIDWPRAALPTQAFLAGQLTDVVIVADLSLAAARDTIRLLAFLKENAPQSRIHLVVNKHSNSTVLELTRKDFESSVERNIDLFLPLDVKTAVAAAKKGTAVPEIGKSAKLSAQLRALTQRIGGVPNASERVKFVDKITALVKRTPKAGAK
ncbi:MAG: AAA family ATPase [Sphingomonadales bacterium]